MDSRKIVFRETGIIAAGELIGSALMLLVYAALDAFTLQVLCSALAGCFVMIANYFFMAVTASVAADRAEQGNVQQAHAIPACAVAIGLHHALLSLAVSGEVSQQQILVATFDIVNITIFYI